MSTRVSSKVVGVYRRHQSTMISPCVAGDLCSSCAKHLVCKTGRPCRLCRRGKHVECDRAVPSAPAFTLQIKDAISLVKNGFASFINRNTAVQLNYSRLAHLRDQSSKPDERLILEYLSGSRRARAAIYGWGRGPVTVEKICPEQPCYPFI